MDCEYRLPGEGEGKSLQEVPLPAQGKREEKANHGARSSRRPPGAAGKGEGISNPPFQKKKPSAEKGGEKERDETAIAIGASTSFV